MKFRYQIKKTLISSLLSLQNTIDQILIISNALNNLPQSYETLKLQLKLAKAEYEKAIPIMTIKER